MIDVSNTILRERVEWNSLHAAAIAGIPEFMGYIPSPTATYSLADFEEPAGIPKMQV